MTLNSSGPISLIGTTTGQSIEKELGGSGTTQLGLTCTIVRNLAGVPTGPITMATNFYGKQGRSSFSVTISSNTTNYVFNKCKVPGYVAGKSCVTLKINSGVYVYSGSTGSTALTVPNTWASGDSIKIINCGYIIGMGGAGHEAWAFNGCHGPAQSGGTAISTAFPLSITNNNTVGGGGGGGGGGGYGVGYDNEGAFHYAGGGGGGGGRSGLTPSAGGATNGCCGNPGIYGGVPGTSGTSSSAGTGGGGGSDGVTSGGVGGNGGGWGSGGAGGCQGSGPANHTPGTPGGPAGPATSGNSYITWTVIGNRYGPLG